MTATYVDTRDVSRLTRFPGNAKRGDVDKIAESVRRNGQYRALVVREIDAELVILAGNHTRDAVADHAMGRKLVASRDLIGTNGLACPVSGQRPASHATGI